MANDIGISITVSEVGGEFREQKSRGDDGAVGYISIAYAMISIHAGVTSLRDSMAINVKNFISHIVRGAHGLINSSFDLLMDVTSADSHIFRENGTSSQS